MNEKLEELRNEVHEKIGKKKNDFHDLMTIGTKYLKIKKWILNYFLYKTKSFSSSRPTYQI